MPGAGGLTQMITIVDKSNKVVGSSKQLKNVFSEAKVAYLERKADIKAQRKMKEEQELQKAIRAMSIADEEERGSTVSRSKTQRHRRPREYRDRRYLDDYIERDSHRGTSRDAPRSPPSPHHSGSPTYAPRRSSGYFEEPAPSQMIRRAQTDMQLQPRQPVRTNSVPDVDLDLAYGEYHDEDLRSLATTPAANKQLGPQQQQKQLGTLVQKCQFLLDEANCAQYSARKIVTHLQDNPDAMAAVALTLAEISNIASKMAPSALTAFKASAPAVMALLASPQFLIAVGVGLGVTVVMFGGYKIIKKIKSRPDEDGAGNLANGPVDGQPREQSMDEMLDVRELSSIEQWRRGIADAQAANLADDGHTEISGYSAATSVEGEFITPFAAQSMGHLPLPREKARPKDRREGDKERDRERDRDGHKKKSRRHRDRDGDSVTASEVSQASSKRRGGDRDKQIVKVKKPSPLRRMFTGTSVKY